MAAMMTSSLLGSRTHPGLRWTRALLAVALAASFQQLPRVATAAEAKGPVIPLPADDAKHLELLGKGVVGKPIPAPDIDDLIAWYMGPPGGGSWTYNVTKGDKANARVESIEPAAERAGQRTWNQKIGDLYLQHMIEHVDGSLGKYGEDDLSLSYGCHFHPGIVVPAGLTPGKSIKVENKALAYKIGHPEKTSYTGDMDITFTYVGAYEVHTPAGTFPAALVRAEFDIRIGPAKVKDVQYSFYSKGVGKVAEIEALKVSALLVYHSDDKTAKVLAKMPVHAKASQAAAKK